MNHATTMKPTQYILLAIIAALSLPAGLPAAE